MLKHCNGALSPNMNQLLTHSVNQTDLKPTEEQQKLEKERLPVEPGPSMTRETPESSEAILARSNPVLMNFQQLPSSFSLPFHQSLAKSPGLLPAMQSLYASQGLLVFFSNLESQCVTLTYYLLKGFMMNGSPGSSGQASSPPVDQAMADAKKLRVQSSMRILKDEPVPEGYVRFR